MKTFNQVKSEFESKNYSLSDLKKGVILYSVIRFLFTEIFTFLVSTIPFLIGFGIITSFYGFASGTALFYLVIHLLFYVFYVKGVYRKQMKPTLEEVDMVIQALKEIKQEKSSK
jgi:hypothetical protein